MSKSGRPAHMAPRFTPEQKAAIVRAVVDGGLSQLRAIAAAERGELDGVGSFKMSRGHLSGLVKREKQKRLIANTSASEIDELSGRIVAAALTEIARIEKLKALRPRDVEQLRKLTSIVRNLRQNQDTKTTAPARRDNMSNRGESFLGRLVHEPQAPVVEPDPAPPEPEPAPAAPPPPKPPQRPPVPTVDDVLADLDRRQRQIAAERQPAPTTLA
jgi:hypothetical protein